MKNSIASHKSIALVSLLLFVLSACPVFGKEQNYTGWERNSPYNKYYDYRERDSLKGKVVGFKKITPLKGMAPGTALILDDGEEKITVHLCPWDYANPAETGIRKNVKTKIKGCWALIDGKDVFLAAKVKQGSDFSFKVRLTRDGTPFWTMDKEQLEHELQQSD